MHELDCLGMRCPQPIIELTKAARTLPKGTQVRVTADDPAFELDCLAWLPASGHRLEDLARDASRIVAIIELR